VKWKTLLFIVFGNPISEILLTMLSPLRHNG
jgi:hypothetical protein